jgi:MFS family permease
MNDDAFPKMYCVNHPQVETLLRCNRCEQPICTRCAILTPTGYRCKNCVRGQQKAFETAQSIDYFFAVGIAGVLSFIGSQVAPIMGFFTIFLGPIIGVIIAEVVRWAVRRRRSRLLFQLSAGAAAAGALPLLAAGLLSALFGGHILGILGLVYQGLYVFLVTSTVYYRLSGLELRR